MAALKTAARKPPSSVEEFSEVAKPAKRPSRHWWLAIIWLVVLGLMSTSLFTYPRTWTFVAALLHMIAPGGVSETTQSAIHLFVRKLTHFGAYAVCFIVLITGPLRGRPIWALALCLALASGDEIHQLFVPGRTGSPWDVAIDFTGALFGRFLYLGIARR